MPKLIREFEYSADIVLDEVGSGPFGNRVIATVTGGQVEGDRIKGTIVGASGDWLLVGTDGFGRLDVRATFKTHDGAMIYVQYHGVVELTEDMAAILGGAGNSVTTATSTFSPTQGWRPATSGINGSTGPSSLERDGWRRGRPSNTACTASKMIGHSLQRPGVAGTSWRSAPPC